MKELALLFGKLGFLSFGGPAAHIALMEDEVVKRRAWLTHEQFLDLLGATNIIPGPNSTEMAMFIGYERARWRGLIVAGLSFIVPAVLITLLIAYAYRVYGSLPDVQPFFFGIRPAVIAVILTAVIRLSKPVMKNGFMFVTGICVAVLSMSGIDEIILLFSAGAAGALWSAKVWRIGAAVCHGGILLPILGMRSGFEQHDITVPTIPTLTALGLFFLKVGAVLYGSGYVLVAFLQDGLVDSRHWLTQTELLDAISIGQFTPGPVLSSATFIGFLILGAPGAAIATGSIFLPSFILVGALGPYIPRLRRSPIVGGFLDGVTSASLGLMLAVAGTLAYSTLAAPASWAILAIAILASVRYDLNAVWVISGGALLGFLAALY